MNKAVDGTINQISSSSFEWWSQLFAAYDLNCFITIYDPSKTLLKMHE